MIRLIRDLMDSPDYGKAEFAKDAIGAFALVFIILPGTLFLGYAFN